jgi:predicted nuclease of predicted toxin-antitoxin system
LQAAGHDVVWIRDVSPGALDEDILSRSRQSNRLLITFDRDFGGLIFAARLPPPPAVLYVRLPSKMRWTEVAERIVHALNSRPRWDGLFAVLQEDGLRVVPFPRGM